MIQPRLVKHCTILLILLIGAFHLSTIREGHNWGGDFAGYIGHAKSLSEGGDYSDTGYIYNEHWASIGPPSYPPMFPLLLLPVYKAFGLNLVPMKVEIVIFFLLSLYLIFLIFRDELPYVYSFALVLLVGMHPFFWHYKDSIMSGIPFLAFQLCAVGCLQKAYICRSRGDGGLRHFFLGGLFILLSIATRNIGLVIVPIVVVNHLLHMRTPKDVLVAVGILLALTVGFVALQFIIDVPIDRFSGHLSIKWNVQSFFFHINGHIMEFSGLWANGYSDVMRVSVFLVLCTLAAVGMFSCLRAESKIFAIFYVISSFCIISLVNRAGMPLELLKPDPPFSGGLNRYYIPIIPFFLFYSLCGLSWIARVTKVSENRLLMILCCLVLSSYVGVYSRQDFGPLRQGVHMPHAKGLFQHISESTGPSDIVGFSKPRVLALFGGTAAIAIHSSLSEDLMKMSVFLDSVDVTHIVTSRVELKQTSWNLVPRPETATGTWSMGGRVDNYVAANSASLELVYENRDFSVYRREYQ